MKFRTRRGDEGEEWKQESVGGKSKWAGKGGGKMGGKSSNVGTRRKKERIAIFKPGGGGEKYFWSEERARW